MESQRLLIRTRNLRGRARRQSLDEKKLRAATRAALFASAEFVRLKHLDAVNVDLVAVDVSGHGNMMSIVLLKGIGIVHRQNLLVLVGNNLRAGAAFNALLSASVIFRVVSLNASLGVAHPAVHRLGIAGK